MLTNIYTDYLKSIGFLKEDVVEVPHSLIALDFVIIPPKELFDLSIQLNNTLPDSDKKLKLHAEHTVPHISIGMCLANAEDVEAITEKMEEVAEEFLPINDLVLESVYAHGKDTIGWNVKKNSWFSALHQKTAKILEEYHQGVEEHDNSCFFHVDVYDPYSGVKYLDIFYQEYAYENFNPHITLGAGEEKYVAPYVGKSFQGGHFALYHLGSGCTCQRLVKKYQPNVFARIKNQILQS